MAQQYFMCRNIRSKNWQMSYVATKDSMLRQKMGRSQLRQRSVMLQHNGDQKAESMSRQNLLCRDTNSCNMEELVETEESTEKRSSLATRKFMSRLVTLTC